MRTPTTVEKVFLDYSCQHLFYHNPSCPGATRADKRKIRKIIRNMMPSFYKKNFLQRKGYKFYKTKSHFIITNLSTEYFLRYENH